MKGRKTGGRKKGTPNRVSPHMAKITKARGQLSLGKQLAVNLMDEQIDILRTLCDVLHPWNADGKPKRGKDYAIWMEVSKLYREYLSMRAPFQSARLAAMQLIQAQPAQRTKVSVTVLDARGHRIEDDDSEEPKTIEHKSEEAA